MDPFEHLNLPGTPDLSGQVMRLSSRPIFTGPYSYVYKGKLRGNGEIVAIKVLNAVDGAALHTMQRKLKRERRTWGALKHPNILPLYGFADEEDFQPLGALVSPWIERGDATRFFKEHGNSLTVNDRMSLWMNVIAGVEYLHTHQPRLVHGDLKPKNILIDDSGRALICDFGLVRIHFDKGTTGMTTTTYHTGTERYLSYELVEAGEDAIPTTASDVYAVGCIGLEFVFGQIPYSRRRSNAGGTVYIDIRAGIPPAERTPTLPLHLESTWATLESCWEQDPHGRPDAVQLRVWIEAEMTQLQIHDGTPPASGKGTQPHLPSLDIEGEGDQEDPTISTVSGTPKPELASSLEPKFPLQSLGDPPSSTPTSTSAIPTTGFIRSFGNFPWNRKKNADPIARVPGPAPPSKRKFHVPPPPPRAASLSYRQLLHRRLQKHQLRSTFSVDTSGPPDPQLFKVSFFVGPTKIGESGWFTNKDAALENAAMQALGWLNTYGYH